ncbi:GNAT family N-acetyltransferase [Gaetbulibacter sp. M235]|uniref:GNAT family N-acetyltransferase n=1 Tax=Gaetbulibacter sp. M235 TaxID=3126510 RepID=UPI00374F4AC1
MHLEIIESYFGEYYITTESSKMNIVAIHDYLSKNTDWSKNIPYNKVRDSVENSLNFGLFYNDKQIGYARVISDYATIAYIGDVYVLSKYRGRGLSKKIMDQIITHPNLQGLRRWILLTDTADWLYKKYGFINIPNPEFYMELHNPNVYN